MNEQLKPGFTYLVEVIRNGVVVDSEVCHNLMPVEGLNHVLGVVLKGASHITAWYVGVYEGNYTPQTTDTMALFPGAATETTTAYDEVTREVLDLGAVAAGAVDNHLSVAEFTFNATKTIYGGFVASSSAKAATSGTLLSAVKFTSPKAVVDNDVLRVTAGFTLVSA